MLILPCRRGWWPRQAVPLGEEEPESHAKAGHEARARREPRDDQEEQEREQGRRPVPARGALQQRAPKPAAAAAGMQQQRLAAGAPRMLARMLQRSALPRSAPAGGFNNSACSVQRRCGSRWRMARMPACCGAGRTGTCTHAAVRQPTCHVCHMPFVDPVCHPEPRCVQVPRQRHLHHLWRGQD